MRPGPSAHVLVVDDDAMTRKLLSFILTEAGYAAVAVEGVTSALRVLEREEVHLILLDVNMPTTDGLEFCRKLRDERYGIPVMFLSGRMLTDDKVAGFDAGADDYLTKPFEPRELLSRVGALLARQLWGTTNGTRTHLRAGGLELDLAELTVRLPSGREVQLTPTEMRVLQCLMMNAGRVVTRELLLTEAWGYDYESESNQVEVYIRRIRRKLDAPAGETCVETVRGLGYRLLSPSQTSRGDTETATVAV